MSRVSLPADLTSPRRARQFVALCADQIGHPEVIELAELLVSELVTNAVSHAGSDVQIECAETDEGMRISVFDGSRQEPLVCRPDAWDEQGRGLLLVETLAMRWGTDKGTGPGKQVWFELSGAPGG